MFLNITFALALADRQGQGTQIILAVRGMIIILVRGMIIIRTLVVQ